MRQIIKISNKQYNQQNILSVNKINQNPIIQQETHYPNKNQSSKSMKSDSLAKYQQSCPATLNNSNEVSFEQPSRKFSMVDLNHRIDIDRVMVDIKLTPLKSNQFTDKIKTIYSCLQWLKNLSPTLLQQVRTAQLIVESIQAKWKKQKQQTRRNSQPSITSLNQSIINESNQKLLFHKRQQSIHSKRKPNTTILNSNIYSQVSPIKQLDQATSRIVYTNFSIKEIQNSCKKQFSHQKGNTIEQNSHSLAKNRQSDYSLSKNRYNNNSLSKNDHSLTKNNMRQSHSSKDISGRVQSDSRPSMQKKDNSIFTVSIFDAQDEEMEKLTRNIQALDRVLQRKGLTIRNDFAKNKIANKTALKEVTLNSPKLSSVLKNDKKQSISNNRHRNNSANKQNL